MMIEVTLIQCSGDHRKEMFAVSEIKGFKLNGCGDTLILARGGYWPVTESIDEIEAMMEAKS